MGDLIRMPHSEVTATLELLDRVGVKPRDFEALRKASSWKQETVGRIHQADQFLWAMLEMEATAKKAGFGEGDFQRMAKNEDMMRQLLNVARGYGEVTIVKRIVTVSADSFNPAAFFGNPNWTIWKGPANGDGLNGDEEQDARWLVLTEVDFTHALFETCLQGETYITGETKLQRLIKANRICLDARFGETLWNEPNHVTLEWLYKTKGITWIEFPGTTLRSPIGSRGWLYLCRHDERWGWFARWLDDYRSAYTPAVVLAS